MEHYMALVSTDQPSCIRLHTSGHDYVYNKAGNMFLDGVEYGVYTSTNFLSHDVNRKALNQVVTCRLFVECVAQTMVDVPKNDRSFIN